MLSTQGLLVPLVVGMLLYSHSSALDEYDGNLKPEIRTDQEDINSGAVSVNELFYRGAHIFSNNFTATDGFGEAPDGPRRSSQDLAGNQITPFLRFNGLDAQSCLECHNSLGMQRGESTMSMPRQLGMVGGSGGVSANVLVFEDGHDLENGRVRNPPHVFGLGYIQRLADEMTEDLLTIQELALREAVQLGEEQRVELVSKGVHFGYLNASPIGAVDTSEFDGISIDLVVRPFQHKGVASSLRNFVSGAMNFHFSVQPEELIKRHLIPNDNPNGTLQNDPEIEIADGDVSAVAAFVAALRPPVEDSSGLEPELVEEGRDLFTAIGCAECHVPSMTIRDSRVTIIDPDVIEEQEELLDRDSRYISLKEKIRSTSHLSISAKEVDSRLLPSRLSHEAKQIADETGRLRGLTFDLSDEYLPDEALPRLRPEEDGTVKVPLYSDLRRHKMGQDLSDPIAQETEIQSILIPPDEFLTRPLWGVADTGPWMHDGRATTLRQAILMHSGDGSEANESIESYNSLTKSEQSALVEFLRSLRTPPMNHEMEPGIVHRSGMVFR